MKNYPILQKKFMTPTYINRGITLIRGESVYLIDENGQKYLDMMTNYGVNILGYNHQELYRKLHMQLDTLISLHGSFASDVRAECSHALINRMGTPYTQVYWGNSGTEAVEAALKFAVLATGRRKFVTATGGYHGKTLGALSATSGQKYRAPFEPLLWEFTSHPFGDAAGATQLIDRNTAAVIVEPIQGESGIIVPPDDYLQTLRRACTEVGALLIIDEIQTGTGRTGPFLAAEQSDVNADICCLGKGLAGGLPVGVTVVTEDVASAITKGVHSSTFGGNPLVCAGVYMVMQILTDKMRMSVVQLGDYFMSELRTIKSKHIREVRGRGLMIGVEVSDGRDMILKELQKKHILAIPASSNVVRFLPPYIIQKQHIDRVVEVLREILIT